MGLNEIMKVLILANNDMGLYKFRKELLQELIFPGTYLENREAEACQVFVSVPSGEFVSKLQEMGCKIIDTPVDRRGMNPVKDLKLLWRYEKIIRKIKPSIVLTYTIKPNIYGAIIAGFHKIPSVVNITGLGSVVEQKSMLQKIIILLYRFAFKKVKRIFVQNMENRKFFLQHNIGINKLELLPGSGVNLIQYSPLEYPDEQKIHFAFISRIMKEKGIDQYLNMAKYIKKRHPQTCFHICGFCEEEYENVLKEYEEQGIIVYHGLVKEIRTILKDIHCTIHPSYYPEGISNVLLESAASGRPIITTDRSGCKEVVDDGINGYIVPEKDQKKLIEAVEKFLGLSNKERKEMGQAGRKKVEEKFDRKIVINAYLKEFQ